MGRATQRPSCRKSPGDAQKEDDHATGGTVSRSSRAPLAFAAGNVNMSHDPSRDAFLLDHADHMMILCPNCRHTYDPSIQGLCPHCGFPVSAVVQPADSPQQRLLQFRRTVVDMTPRTWVVPVIVAVNIAIYVAMFVAGARLLSVRPDLMLRWGANFGPLTLDGQWWRLLTCTFLHFSVLHIGFNMYVLWQIGHFVERLVGNTGFLVLYVTSGLAASIASLAWNPTVVSAGASGAVFGVCGALLGFVVLRSDSIPREVITSLRSSMVTFLMYNAAFALVLQSIDWAAHAGGFIFGIFCGAVLSQKVVIESVRKRWIRNGMLLIASAVILAVACFLLPSAPANPFTGMETIFQLDTTARSRTEAIRLQTQRGEISDEQAAELLNDQVLPQWRQAVDTLDGFRNQKGMNAVTIATLRSYLLKNQQGVQSLIEYFREHDLQKLQQYNRLVKEAAALSEDL